MNCSIICLIYQSVPWLKFVHEQVAKYTDLNRHEFFFMANDATLEVRNFLQQSGIPHFWTEYPEEKRKEWFINNVYRGYNLAATKAKEDYLVFINSDMAFSPQWLDNLIKYYTGSECITSRLVESGRLPSGQYGIGRYFGDQPYNFMEAQFLEYAQSIRETRAEPGGLYMPLFVRKKDFLDVGGYPEGNIKPDSDIFNPQYAKKGEPCLPGDFILMMKLAMKGIRHLTAFDSIVYHFQRGESDYPNP
ncbi:MAG TPA: glycosyltransferase family A protein [Bacillota bacterium]|nr:glycosyltransferase family A protein [Bacillota bacterium]